MISRNEVLKRGVQLLLVENAREREQLLKLMGISEPRGTRQNAIDILQATGDEGGDTKPRKRRGKYNGKHWMQLPKNKHKVAAMVAKMQRGARRARRASSNA